MTVQESAPARPRRSRLLWGIFGVIAVVVAGAVTFWVRTQELPTDWSDKAAFCQSAGQFSIDNPDHRQLDRGALLESMRQSAPWGLRSDLETLIDALAHPPKEEGATKPTSQRVGKFIETRCGVNLPGVIT